MSDEGRFSARHGLSADAPEVLSRESAPEELRLAAAHFAIGLGTPPEALRDILLDHLGLPPDPRLLVARDNVIREVYRHLEQAEWFEVYDFIELVHDYLLEIVPNRALEYEIRINRYFQRRGVGWQLRDGKVVAREAEAAEELLARADRSLAEAGVSTAQRELRQAILDLSRRPTPDLTGAVQHSIAALECVAREVSGDKRATLGALLSRNPGLIPTPLPSALEKLWGYSSEVARHLREGSPIDRAEVSLVVGIAAAMAAYLVERLPKEST